MGLGASDESIAERRRGTEWMWWKRIRGGYSKEVVVIGFVHKRELSSRCESKVFDLSQSVERQTNRTIKLKRHRLCPRNFTIHEV